MRSSLRITLIAPSGSSTASSTSFTSATPCSRSACTTSSRVIPARRKCVSRIVPWWISMMPSPASSFAKPRDRNRHHSITRCQAISTGAPRSPPARLRSGPTIPFWPAFPATRGGTGSHVGTWASWRGAGALGREGSRFLVRDGAPRLLLDLCRAEPLQVREGDVIQGRDRDGVPRGRVDVDAHLGARGEGRAPRRVVDPIPHLGQIDLVGIADPDFGGGAIGNDVRRSAPFGDNALNARFGP